MISLNTGRSASDGNGPTLAADSRSRICRSLSGARGADVGGGRAMALASMYGGGIGVMYASLGVGSALAGRAFGTFMANPWVMVPIALLFPAMAASMFGAFELNLPPALQTR